LPGLLEPPGGEERRQRPGQAIKLGLGRADHRRASLLGSAPDPNPHRGARRAASVARWVWSSSHSVHARTGILIAPPTLTAGMIPEAINW
jgi:hypothetical protein